MLRGLAFLVMMIDGGCTGPSGPCELGRDQPIALTTETTEVLAEASSIEIGDLIRMTVDMYEVMARLGVLDDLRVELVNGLLVKKTTQGPNHTLTLDLMAYVLRRMLPEGWQMRAARPISLPKCDEPEPDLAILRGEPGVYQGRHPGPGDVAMVVEVSDSSLRLDCGDKLRAYARAGIAHYWIVNLVDRRIETYRDPGRGGYAASTHYGNSSEAPVGIDGVEVGRIAVAQVLSSTDADFEGPARR